MSHTVSSGTSWQMVEGGFMTLPGMIHRTGRSETELTKESLVAVVHRQAMHKSRFKCVLLNDENVARREDAGWHVCMQRI